MDEKNTIAGEMYATWEQGSALYVAWSMKHHISYYEMLVLYVLDRHDGMTQKGIGEYYGLPKQTVHNVIHEFKTKQYIVMTTNDQDKREKKVVLNTLGKQYAASVLTSLYRMEDRVCKNVGHQRMKEMIETVDLYNTLFKKEMEKEKDETT